MAMDLEAFTCTVQNQLESEQHALPLFNPAVLLVQQVLLILPLCYGAQGVVILSNSTLNALQRPATAGRDMTLAFDHVVANAALGPVPGGVVIALVALFYAVVAYFSFTVKMSDSELAHGSVHV